MIETSQMPTTEIDTSSHPWAFVVSSARISLVTFSLSMSRPCKSTLHAGWKFGRMLLFTVVVHCLTNYSFRMLAFVCKFLIKIPFPSNGGVFLIYHSIQDRLVSLYALVRIRQLLAHGQNVVFFSLRDQPRSFIMDAFYKILVSLMRFLIMKVVALG